MLGNIGVAVFVFALCYVPALIIGAALDSIAHAI